MVKFTWKDGCAPTISTEHSAGADMVANEEVVIQPGEVRAVCTGVWIDSVDDDVLRNSYLALFIRSSLAMKQSICLANGTGVVDMDYPDEIKVLLHNFGENPVSINKGERIAQMILTPHLQHFMNCKRIEEERIGGFGSTGVGPEVGGLSTADTTEHDAD